MKTAFIRLAVFSMIVLSVSLACRIGGIELHYDPINEAWFEPVSGISLSDLGNPNEIAAMDPIDAAEAVAKTAELCQVHVQTPLCKAVLSGDDTAIESLAVEFQVSDLKVISEMLSEAFASFNTNTAGQP